MTSRKNMQIAAVLAVVVVAIFILLGLFGIGRTQSAPETESSLTGPQELLKEIAQTGGVTELQKYETRTGAGRAAAPGDTITVHYTGALPDGTVFDSSRSRGNPLTFILGVSPIIDGWQQGLIGAQVGERFLLAIPPHLGYGAAGQGTIPPNATLIFDIEVVDLAPPPTE